MHIYKKDCTLIIVVLKNISYFSTKIVAFFSVYQIQFYRYYYNSVISLAFSVGVCFMF